MLSSGNTPEFLLNKEVHVHLPGSVEVGTITGYDRDNRFFHLQRNKNYLLANVTNQVIINFDQIIKVDLVKES